jgi:hypothetical protein
VGTPKRLEKAAQQFVFNHSTLDLFQLAETLAHSISGTSFGRRF